MKTLVVGGAGMIGRQIVQLLVSRGHDVVVGGRRDPMAGSPGAGVPMLLGDYAAGGFDEAALEPFDAVVFAAGQDVRHADAMQQTEEFWARYQADGVPNFFATAKRAGVRRGVQIGSYYHMLRPDLAERVPYIRARQLADDRSRALADADFNVSTLNASNVVGPGQPNLPRLVAWARGEAVGTIPDFAPVGGTNHISVRSVAEAAAGALERAEPGVAYLVGDENYRWLDYFRLVLDVLGADRTIDEQRDEPHPLVYEMIVPRGTIIEFDPKAGATALGYRLNDVKNALEAAAVEHAALRP